MSLIFVDLHGTIGPNNCDRMRISQLKTVKLCTKTMSLRVIFVHFVDRSFLAVHQTISENGNQSINQSITHSLNQEITQSRNHSLTRSINHRMKGLKECRLKPGGSETAEKKRGVRVWCHFMPLEKTVIGCTRKKFMNHLMKVVVKT